MGLLSYIGSKIAPTVQSWQSAPGGNTGSWFGLKDRGYTEQLQNYIAPSSSLTGQGGSNLSGLILGAKTSAYTPPPTNDQKTPPPPGDGTSGTGSGGLLSGQVLGSSTVGGDNGQQSAEDAARAWYDAQVASESAAYDRNAALAQGQISEAGNQEKDALSILESVLSKAGTRRDEQKAESGKLTESAIGEAGSTARNTQRSNRNVLRALGILNSTYAADKLQEPTNQFDVERARLVRGNIDNFKKLDDWYNERFNEYQSGVKSVKQQFATIVDKINTDLRFNGEDRLAALKAANAALQTRLASIGTEFKQIAQNVDNAKMNFATQIANLYLSQNPQANINGILSSAMNTANQVYSPQTVGIEQRKKTLTGV